MKVVGIDPGATDSAAVLFEEPRVVSWKLEANEGILAFLREQAPGVCCAIELTPPYAMKRQPDGFPFVPRQVQETAIWVGRFMQAWFDAGHPTGSLDLVMRQSVKAHIIGQSSGSDAMIRDAIADRYGGREAAVGRKAAPGPLYRLKADTWQALAVAITYHDQQTRLVGDLFAQRGPTEARTA